MSFGLTAVQKTSINKLVIEELQKYNATVYIFGSRARGKHHPFSDLDLLIIEAKDNKIPAIVLSKIKEDLENSHLPFAVDLVRDNDLAHSYRATVEQEKIVWPTD